MISRKKLKKNELIKGIQIQIVLEIYTITYNKIFF